jgi:hypothetical protein
LPKSVQSVPEIRCLIRCPNPFNPFQKSVASSVHPFFIRCLIRCPNPFNPFQKSVASSVHPFFIRCLIRCPNPFIRSSSVALFVFPLFFFVYSLMASSPSIFPKTPLKYPIILIYYDIINLPLTIPTNPPHPRASPRCPAARIASRLVQE